MKDILLAKSFQRKSACFWRAFNKSQHVCVCVSPLTTINCLFPSIVKTMLFVTKIHKYNLFWESLEGFYCGRRKPANPCHPIDWFCRVFGEFDRLLPWTLNFFPFFSTMEWSMVFVKFVDWSVKVGGCCDGCCHGHIWSLCAYQVSCVNNCHTSARLLRWICRKQHFFLLISPLSLGCL